jgi:hypothetical protein
MFACLYLPPPARPDPRTVQDLRFKPQAWSLSTGSERWSPASAEIVQLARDFSPRVEMHDDRTVTLDISGLGSLLGEARAIGEELRRTAADRALRVHIALASTATAAILLAQSRAGLGSACAAAAFGARSVDCHAGNGRKAPAARAMPRATPRAIHR